MPEDCVDTVLTCNQENIVRNERRWVFEANSKGVLMCTFAATLRLRELRKNPVKYGHTSDKLPQLSINEALSVILTTRRLATKSIFELDPRSAAASHKQEPF